MACNYLFLVIASIIFYRFCWPMKKDKEIKLYIKFYVPDLIFGFGFIRWKIRSKTEDPDLIWTSFFEEFSDLCKRKRNLGFTSNLTYMVK